MSPLRKSFLLIASLLLAASDIATACPVCFGAPGSQSTEAVGLAILFLLGVLGLVLACIVAFFVYLARCSEVAPPDSTSLRHG